MEPSVSNRAGFLELAQYLSAASGIELDESKGYLLEARLQRIVQEQGCQSYLCLVEKARRDPSGKLRQVLVDAISTNETSFFREPQQFALLAHKLLPKHFEKRNPQRCRIWSAAAATGQEIYSVGIVLKEMLGSLERYRIQLLGTDISSAALDRASRGLYSPLEVSRGLSPERLKRYFLPKGNAWGINDEIRSLATFHRLNLLEPAPGIGMFDIVFCRNVSIYFSNANRTKLFSNLAAHLERGGVLIVSMTESLGANPNPFVRREYRGVAYYELA